MGISSPCGSETLSRSLDIVILIDPSGHVLDAKTGQPIKGVSVTLYHVPNALPDTAIQTRDCRIASRRGGISWDVLLPATLMDSRRVDPLGDARLGFTPTITPEVYSQTTGTDGRYAWDVAEGCWYVLAQAPNYLDKVSPLVGVPPAVLDLDIHLTLGVTPKVVVNLPLIRR